MNCEVCEKNFSGIVPYNQHIESEKHKRKVANLSFNIGNAEPSKTEVKSVSVFNPMHCPACNISFDSFIMFQSHSLTPEHVDNVTKTYRGKEVDNPRLDVVTSTSSKDTIENSLSKNPIPPEDEADTILPPMQSFETNYLASFTECKTCNKQFSGPEPYKQHLVSALHQKKVEMKNFLSNTTSQNALNKFECVPCKKIFSGPVPLQQHMVSEIHRKKVQQVLLLEQYNKSKELESSSMMEVDSSDAKNKVDSSKNVNVNNSWFCKICLIQCSGFIPYKQHLAGDAHLKNSRRAELLKSSINMKPNSEDGTIAGDIIPISNNDENTFAAPMLHVGFKTLNTETDIILPEALKSLSMVSPADINVKEFYPDAKINFDDNPNEQAQDENDSIKAIVNAYLEYNQTEDTTDANTNMIVDVEYLKNEQLGDLDVNQISINKSSVEFEMDDVYEECKLCNVKLRNKSEALSHFESYDHFVKKYRPE